VSLAGHWIVEACGKPMKHDKMASALDEEHEPISEFFQLHAHQELCGRVRPEAQERMDVTVVSGAMRHADLFGNTLGFGLFEYFAEEGFDSGLA